MTVSGILGPGLDLPLYRAGEIGDLWSKFGFLGHFSGILAGSGSGITWICRITELVRLGEIRSN